MTRLIDADVFKENMDYVCGAGGCLEPVTSSVIEFVKRHIDAQTEVDAVPVVRCKDCKWMTEDGHCREFANASLRLNPDDYCSAGVKKDGTID